MSQLVLDDQLKASHVLQPLRKWITVQRLRDLRPHQLILDDRVPQILWTLKQPTFVTIDHGFWKKTLCPPDYAVLVFSLRDDQQVQLPGLSAGTAPETGVSYTQEQNGESRADQVHRY
jgi:hypothetical protein